MWRSIGPNDISDRVTDLVVSPTDADVALAASETGGIWETIDGGGGRSQAGWDAARPRQER
jgi:hypothetical protein